MAALAKTRLSTKGQVILPKSVRDERGWAAGTSFTVENHPEGILLRPEKPFPNKTMDEVFGMLKYDGPPISIEEMDAGIEAMIRERHARGRY